MRISRYGKKSVRVRDSKVSSTSVLEDKIKNGSKNINTNHAPVKEVLEDKGVADTTKILDEEEVVLETEKEEIKNNSNKTEIKKKKVKEKHRKSNKKEFIPPKDIGKLSGKRIACMVLTGLMSSTVLAGVCYGVYYNQIRYPRQMVENIETSGLGGINRWVTAMNTLDNETIKEIISSDSFIAKEIEYANGNEDKINFIEKVVGTVSYSPKIVKALNKYGNTMIDRNNKIVYTNSLVNGVGEEVTLSFIDYSSIELDKDKIQSLMKDKGVSLGVADYSNKLVDVICSYISSLDDSDIPLAEIDHVPSMTKVGDLYYMSDEEDVFIDKLLFSSDDFYSFLVRFSEVAAGEEANPEWESWNKLSDEEKKDKEEPSKTKTKLKPTSAWIEWNAKSEEEKKSLKEPLKYNSVEVANTTWCGSYYLLNEHNYVDSNGISVNKPIVAGVGDGTIENPASFDTGIVTSIFVTDSSGKRVSKPVKVKLIDYKVSQEALNYFESKDTRNRGYDIKSEVQYASYTFEVTNLSNETIEVYDNSSLADSLANLAPRTGTVYGLQDKVTLGAYETGVIESWGSSVELNKKYLIWGSDFKRELPVIWFRVLAGDIDDPSEDKGVTLNTTRYAETSKED